MFESELYLPQRQITVFQHEQRSAAEITRVLRERDEISYFGGDESEEEVDSVEDVDSEGSEMSVSNLESSDTESEVEDEAEEIGRRRKFVYGKDRYKWCLDLPETRGRRSNITVILPKAIGAVVSSGNSGPQVKYYRYSTQSYWRSSLLSHTSTTLEDTIQASASRPSNATGIASIFSNCNQRNPVG
ncbi:hypothetical protein QE152_g34866 [Popillia japonica]|uniref:Uncharacterized protein n=1 Tax=Popillia japonica TaxID=7064 RepID=A0AAW1ITU5_POPJA